MHGQDANPEVAARNAQVEAQQLYRWLGMGVDIHATTLNLLANTNEAPMNTILRRYEPSILSLRSDCFGNGEGSCSHRATHSAIYDADGGRIALAELPDYIPQDSMTATEQTRSYVAYCRTHFFADLTDEDRDFIASDGGRIFLD